ncbi:helix-turn-helix domain-containing protein [Erysipelothrix urinaevulpis]|uniref:winged helix-turn-helix transcriptional regulator n=1 Tax=Erysipelothrix urinaevulpis TaxID=2683717 RepID=UPI0013579A79|nr:helix-turn-helix domain-containing protein [Erysipelothrix urinaevulpis]
MTEFEHVVFCRVDDALAIITGKWKPTILLTLIYEGPLRYGQLKRKIVGITPKMLSSQLKELEEEGLILREEYPEIPPKVVYSMTEYGMTIKPILSSLHDWGINHVNRQSRKE